MIEVRYMNYAIESALDGIRAGEGGPFGACIVDRDGVVLATAHNEVLKTNDATRHAEVVCISKASEARGSWDLSGCTLYATTECCPMCFAAAHWARISTIVFGTTIEDVALLGFNELPISNETMNEHCTEKIVLEKNTFRAECLALLDAWKSLDSKQTY